MFLCFCLLIGLGHLATNFGSKPWMLAAAEAAAFLLPALLLFLTQPEKETLLQRLRPKKLPKGGLRLTVSLGVTVAVLSLFLNVVVYQLVGMTGADLSTTALDAPQTGLGFVGRLLIIVLLSALVEELFLRGTLFAAHEKIAGTAVCLLMNGVFFAMLHGSLLNFAGPLVAGAAYAYLTYVFGSVWPAVLAHIVNNLYYMIVIWFTETYAAFGIWNYFAAINGLLLLLFLYLTLRVIECLLVRGAIPKLEKSAGLYDVLLLIRNPGILAFAVAFLIKAVLHWI